VGEDCPVATTRAQLRPGTAQQTVDVVAPLAIRELLTHQPQGRAGLVPLARPLCQGVRVTCASCAGNEILDRRVALQLLTERGETRHERRVQPPRDLVAESGHQNVPRGLLDVDQAAAILVRALDEPEFVLECHPELFRTSLFGLTREDASDDAVEFLVVLLRGAGTTPCELADVGHSDLHALAPPTILLSQLTEDVTHAGDRREQERSYVAVSTATLATLSRALQLGVDLRAEPFDLLAEGRLGRVLRLEPLVVLHHLDVGGGHGGLHLGRGGGVVGLLGHDYCGKARHFESPL